MSELVIRTHDFEKSKNELKIFSEQAPEDLELLKVDISGGFLGLGNHKVTGYELNSLTSQVQDYLIDFNKLHTKFIKEFGQVYNALEALDKDYIQAILIAIKAAEKANNDVKAAQNDITKTIEIQRKTISALKQFKEKIEAYKHLVDIDNMWTNSQELQKDLASVSKGVINSTEAIKENKLEIEHLQKFKQQMEQIKHLKNIDELWDSSVNLKKIIATLDEKIAGIIEMLENQVQNLESLNAFKKQMEGYKHIKDIDKLWDGTLKIQDEISSINNDVKNLIETVYGHRQTIQILCEFKDNLEKYKHLNEVDEIWNSCQNFERNIASTNDVVKVHQSQIENLQNIIKEFHDKSEERSQLFSKKLKVAYALAGSSIGIAFVEFVLLVARIL